MLHEPQGMPCATLRSAAFCIHAPTCRITLISPCMPVCVDIYIYDMCISVCMDIYTYMYIYRYIITSCWCRSYIRLCMCAWAYIFQLTRCNKFHLALNMIACWKCQDFCVDHQKPVDPPPQHCCWLWTTMFSYRKQWDNKSCLLADQTNHSWLKPNIAASDGQQYCCRLLCLAGSAPFWL